MGGGANRGEGCGECFPGMHQAPSLIPSNTEKWRGGRREGRSKNIKENKNR